MPKPLDTTAIAAELLGHVEPGDLRGMVWRLVDEVERLRAVADITDAATAYVHADPGSDDVEQYWHELEAAVEHYETVQRIREADRG